MKKGMIVVTLFSILFFLVSLSAVSTSFSRPPTKVLPKSQQQPSTGQIKDQIKAKDKFWDLAIVDQCFINGVKYSGKTINVKVGEAVTFNCDYKVITIPVHDITIADAAYWGSGNLTYKNIANVYSPLEGIIGEEKQETRKLPKFTWEDVKKWQKSIKKPGRKTWIENMVFTWTPLSHLHIGEFFVFKLDTPGVINEAEVSSANNYYSADISINP